MKRETGENPVRTRHRVLQAEATDPLGEPGREQMCQSNKPGDLPFAVQERKNSASVSSFRIYSQKKPPSGNEDNENKTVLYHIQFCDPFRTANSSWPELFRSCTAKGRSPGLLL